MRRSFYENDLNHENARAFRNRLVISIFISLLVSVALVWIQGQLPKAEFVHLNASIPSLSRWELVMLVMVFGSVGALVTAIPAMARIPTVNSPFNFPLPQGILKIVLGSLTSLVGVIVVGTTGINNGFTSLTSLISVALVFGAGQQAVTQFLDKRAGDIISQLGK